MRVSIIVAVDRENGIGKENALLVHLPEDLAFFKRTTLGHHIVMGRRTYESIGRPLPGRVSVVVTRSAATSLPEGVLRAESLDSALALCAGDDEVFITGGAQLYAAAIERADRLIVTHIDAAFDADAHFPTIDASRWHCSEAGPWQQSKAGWRFRVCEYAREDMRA